MGTATSARLGFKAGVKDYRLTYYMKDYRVDVTDLLAAFRVIAQPGVPPEEAGFVTARQAAQLPSTRLERVQHANRSDRARHFGS